MQGKKETVVKGKTKKPRVSNQVTLGTNHPIPFAGNEHAYSIVNNVSYLPFLAPKDTYAQDLLEARLLSTTHNACIVTKKNYCAGKGIRDKEGKELPQNIIDWLRSVNLKNQSVTKLNKKIFEDKFTWGNVPIELVRFTVAGKKKFFVYVHNFLEWRLGKPNEEDIIEYAVQSKLFLRSGYVTLEMLKNGKRLPLYNPNASEKQNWKRDENGVERTLIWYKNEISGFPYYGLPSAVACMIYQLLEYKGARYNLDNFENNMVVAALLALKGNLSQEEANRIGKQMINTYTGDGKRGRTVVVASEEGIDGSDFHKLDTKTDGSFTDADNTWVQKIILANEWDAVLAGIVSPSTLGKGSGFITKILEHKLNTVILPEQEDLMDEVWNLVFQIADEWLGLGLSEFKLEIENGIDISGLTDVDITPAVTRNEVRKAKRLPEDPSEKGNEYMKSTGPQPKLEGKKEEEDV